MFPKNENNLDRIIRLVLAVVFFGVALTAGENTVLLIGGLVLGLVMMVTAVWGFCPLYRLFGISTYRPSAK